MPLAKAQRRKSRRRRAAVERLCDEDRRMYESIGEKVDYVPHPEYRLVATEQRLFGAEAPRIAVHPWCHFLEGDQNPRRPAKRRKNLSREDEAELFMRYNYARYRLAILVSAQKRRFSGRRIGEALKWRRRALASRADLVSANLPLVVAMARRMRVNSIDFAELVSDGNMALMRAVDKFDVSRGYKFSTYACRAILKAFSRLVTKVSNYRQRFPTEYQPEMERSDETDRRHHEQRELAIEDLRRVLVGNTAELTPVERAVVGARFAVVGHDRPQTLKQVGELVGLSKERVRQVQNLALGKLRAALDDPAA